jgi:hypothetical protein
MTETFKSELYNKFFLELKKNENIDKETFYNSEFHFYDFFELDEKRDCTRCVCDVKITKAYVLKSYILDKEILIGSECLKNFINDQKVLKNAFLKRCLLCHNLNIGKNRQLCNECKIKEKCIKCKLQIPKPPFIICNFCKTYTPTFENFITLSVDIPLKLAQIISLNDCLKYTFKNEIFDKDNQVNCDFCGIKNKSTKQNKIWKSPKILIIHFKRFKVNDYGYNASKITNQIIYPINDFDIKKYFDKYSPHKNNSKYDLIGINIHQEFSHKSIDIGHYISIVKNRYNNEWYLFNDSNEPIKVNLSELQNKNAYMLFYFRKD